MSNSEKMIPRSLKECYATDSVSGNLWGWSYWIENWGKRLLVVLIVIGIISTVADAFEVAEIDEDLVILSVVTSAVTWGLYAFLEYCAFRAVSLLIAALATIVQNTKITANVALYNTAKEEGQLSAEGSTGTPSTSYGSGSALSKLASEKASAKDMWICKECGSKNEGKAFFCKDCGTYK